MLEPVLPVDNFHWLDDSFRPVLDLQGAPGPSSRAVTPAMVHGRFACASESPDGGAMLVRDRLGLNKLFVSVHESGAIVAANYLIDLVTRGVPFECIHSVPAGHIVHLAPCHGVVQLHGYSEVTMLEERAVDDIGRQIRQRLELWFSRLAAQFGERRILVCLSGGLDSGLIAALARQYFSDVTAYTFAFVEPGAPPTDDAIYAERLAEALGIPLRIVPAAPEDVIASVEDAICYGQDWRDFNVHCAIVNVILGKAIERDMKKDDAARPSLLFTGDLANEFLADYTPVSYAGREFYTLPHVQPDRLRLALVRGLDAGDREVGVFRRYGLDVMQPYALVLDEYMRLPASMLVREGFKQALAKTIAGDLLPAFVLDRRKVRAQIGSSTPVGILPVLLEHGYDAPWLRRAFCRLFMIEDETFLNRFIRAGRYRVVNQSAGKRALVNGYIAA
jgi:asparagine synthetase B (glutamine-hydrolysing)